jgi:hypothetical protein
MLIVESDDPFEPSLSVPVYGYFWPWDTTTNDQRDNDGDGLPDFLELIAGTDPALPDTDGDGLSDGTEDRNGNGIRDPRETSAVIADTDDDGLLDGEEDRNGNGGVDGNESSPLFADTDTDHFSDYSEVMARTDSLDPESLLMIGQVAQVAGGTSLRWNVKYNVHYVIQQSQDLIQWSTAPSGASADEQADLIADRDETRSYRCPNTESHAYYRITVSP